MDPILAVIASVTGPVLGFADSLIYTEQERNQYGLSRDALTLEQNKLKLAEQQLIAQNNLLKTQAILAKQNSETLIVGIGLVGLISIGALAVLKS